MKTKSHSISGAFVFTLLGAFAVFSMLLVVLGAQAYRTTVDGASAHTRKRIAAAFVRNAVRAQDERGAIAVEDRDGLPVLATAIRGSSASCLPRPSMILCRRTASRSAPRRRLSRRWRAIC